MKRFLEDDDSLNLEELPDKARIVLRQYVGSCPITPLDKLALKTILDIPEHIEPVLLLSRVS